jgi:YD repeat-containing protein
MRKITTILLLLFWKIGFGQNQEIKSTLPTIIPPSPTVSALMKFEEVAVSNYTGVPDISIPLFSSATLSKDIGINIALKYHSGVGADDRASDVGLGWSLITGGTISRTVRGLPDEILIYPGGLNGPGKIGVYHNSLSQNANNYYYFTQNIANENQDYYRPLNSFTTQQLNIGNEFLWSAANTNKYDTEHDLWQFNFMGFSGRFYIKKNTQTNQLEVQPLDDYRVKIVNNYAPDQYQSTNLYIPTGFTIYDEKGYKYIFDVVENSVNKFANSNTYAIKTADGSYSQSNSENIQADKSFKSSFHLSKVYDVNNNLIIEIVFKNENYIESFSNSSQSSTDLDEITMADNNNCSEFPPLKSINNSMTIVSTKKIDYIDVKGFSKIYFDFLVGRLDTNFNLKNQIPYLNSITVKDYFNNAIKKVNFEYDYSQTLFKRMILKKIKDYSNQENPLETEFRYKENLTNGKYIGKDYWGYLNLTDPCYSNLDIYKRVSVNYCGTDLIETIQYPTGGFTKFNFEPNTYTYKGNQPVTDYFEDDQNMDLISTENINFSGYHNTQLLNTSNIDKIKFYPSINLYGYPDVENQTAIIEVKNETTNTWITTGVTLACYNPEGNCCVDFYPEVYKQYRISYSNLYYSNPNPGSSISYEIYRKNYTKQCLSGGGNRINSIEYFEKTNTLPIKTKFYNYNYFNNPNKSSGSLAFSKPLFDFYDMFTSNNKFGPYSLVACSNNPFDFIYKTFTSGNNYIPLKTGGADVGYQNVTVKELNNGETQFVYTSPIDFPEENIPSGPPFIPTKNFDYKRGLLKSEIVYNNSNSKIVETIIGYEIIENIKHTGTRFKKPTNCYSGSMFSNYDQYIEMLNNQNPCIPCRPNYAMPSSFLCGLPLNVNTPKIMPYPIFEAYGWAKLSSKSTSNYFYSNGATTPNVVTTNETFSYNSLNKQIASHTVSDTLGEISTTNYFYHTGNSPTSQNRISEIERIETKKGTGLLSESKINYSNTFAGNQSFLPSTIQVKKGQYPSEVRLRNNLYDEFGHVLEVEQESGVKICYIYGYNKTQPIAKIENLAYSSIPVSTIENLQNKSNADNDSCTSVPCSGNEENLRVELNALRSTYPNAIITTYTYNPLIGVTSITDSKGDVVFYNYDSFGRLQTVKDKDGNVLSENQYNYRPN